MAIKDRSVRSTRKPSEIPNGVKSGQSVQRQEQQQNMISHSDGSDSTKKKPIAYAGPEQIVYEGGKVQLEGFCNLDQNELELNRDLVYDWIFVSEGSDATIPQTEFISIKNPTFTAPYVDFKPIGDNQYNENVGDRIISNKDYKPYSNLIFQLVVTDKSTNLKSDPSFVNIIVKMIQRALVLQGGGALGAYELGSPNLSEAIEEADRLETERSK